MFKVSSENNHVLYIIMPINYDRRHLINQYTTINAIVRSNGKELL